MAGVYPWTIRAGLSPELFRLADVPYRGLHGRVLDALIRDPDPRYGEALRVIEYLQGYAVQTGRAALKYGDLEVLDLEWSQTVDLPPLIGEVLALVRSARLLIHNGDRRIGWVQYGYRSQTGRGRGEVRSKGMLRERIPPRARSWTGRSNRGRVLDARARTGGSDGQEVRGVGV